jgi:hypothetical protein
MNWVKENKFLTGFLAVLLIGVGALGYEVYSASNAYDEAVNQYTTKSSEYNRLRHLTPYPDKKVLDALGVQKTEAAAAITAFQADLAKRAFPLDPSITPERFQDILKASVSAVRANAAEAGVALPAKFFLGFDTYEGRPPASEAAAPLGRQLKAIEWVVNQLIASKITELMDLKRPELPEEKAKGGAAKGRNEKAGGDRPDRAGKGRQDLVSKQPFDLVIKCRQHLLASVLNTVIGPKAPQFYIPRLIRIKNEKEKGPSRAVDVAPAAPVQDPNAPKAPDQRPTANYIVGEEMIEAAIRLEVVDFAEVAAK